MWYYLVSMLKSVELKALDTFGNCQRPVFLLGVSQHMQTCENIKPVKI